MSNSGLVTYQQIHSTDVERLKCLLRIFGEAFDEIETYQRNPPSDAYLQTLLSKSHFIAVAASKDDELVAGLAAYVLDKFEQDRREIYIYDLAVSEAHRRQGIATGLINELQRIAAKQDSYVIFVQADVDDAPAIALYESLGTKETAHHFDIAVHRTNQQ
ncbi:MAG: AAC(3)-I family aminoglycoside N-acetyltransferase [Pseudomonadota bacterium]